MTFLILLQMACHTFKACSARPASKVLHWMLGAVVRRLSRGKYIILCESRGQRALNGSVLLRDGISNLATAFLKHLIMKRKINLKQICRII